MRLSHALVEGGQTWAHRVRMVRQVLKIAIFFSIILGIAAFTYLIVSIDPLLFQGAWYHLKAEFGFSPEISINSAFWEKITHIHGSGQSIQVNASRALESTRPYYDRFVALLLHKGKIALYCSGASYVAAIFFFIIRGSQSKKKIHISGRKISLAWKISLKLKWARKSSSFKLCNLPLVKETETQHILITGGTGSGKTNCFHHILPQIRAHEQRAVVVDTTGVFVDKYFREGKDVILNPFDTRGQAWHPWIECVAPYDYKAIAESLIPQSYSEEDNYWRSAARTLFSALLQKTSDAQKTSELIKWVLYASLVDLAGFLQATKAAAVIDINSEKTAASVRSVAATFLECLDTLKDTSTPFSIREWVQKEKDDGWLFLYCNPDQRAEINPLLSCWFSIANRALLQMQPSMTRRLWFILDELASLNRLRNLEHFVVESRKYGGCGLLSLQSPAQMDAIYGEKIGKIITGNCSTKIAFSEQDPEIADRISRFFGQREIVQFQEGISYGAHEMRDGVSISGQHRHQPTVSATEIQSLGKNQAYVKLPGYYPVTKIQFPFPENTKR